MFLENIYRTHDCSNISEIDVDKEVRVSGWVENIRDHGGVMFIDLRDHYGMLQVVLHDDGMLKGVNKESAITISGKVRMRDSETINTKIATGTIEVFATKLIVQGKVTEQLPFEVPNSTDTKEEVRLRYRFLDLRNKSVHSRIMLRSKVMSFLRNKMESLNFLEIQTPILSTSSPEGARDYLIPSRKHHGRFYALPQAPQIFKQLLMVSGFDRYFQIAPCFRDEDARADRTPGEFYQLDLEMSFAEQEDIFKIAQEVLPALFEEFSDKKVDKVFKRIPYEESMLKYGTDKPDLRNPLEIVELSDLFIDSAFKPFANKTVRGIRVPNMATQSKGFFEKMEKYAIEIGMKGLGYVKVTSELEFLGPIDKFLSDELRGELKSRCKLEDADVLYFIADTKKSAPKFAGQIRDEVAKRLDICEKDTIRFALIIDFPMYEIDEQTSKIIFTHNPFSMPQGGLEALNSKDPLDIYAYQYDVVCNGVEIVSGAVRNHDLETMVKAFEIAGYTENDIEQKFGALYNAFKFGAPPHAGMAAGIDRLIMILLDIENIREVIAFPLNSNAQDMLLGAPTQVTEQQLRDVHIKIR